MTGEMENLTISELERRSGVPRYTIHHYVKKGLLPPPIKTSKTMAYYGPSHLERLRLIREIKGEARVPLSFLAKMLAEREGGQGESMGAETAELPGEPLSDPRQARRRKLIEAGLLLFARKGYRRATVADIAEAAGISTGAFYLYYKDKRELFIEAVDEAVENFIGMSEEGVMKDPDALRRAMSRARLFFDNYELFSGILNQLRAEMTGEGAWAREKVIELHRRMAEPIARDVRNAIKRGMLREVDPELMAYAIMGMAEFLALRLTFDDGYTFEEAVSFMIDIMINGIRKV